MFDKNLLVLGGTMRTSAIALGTFLLGLLCGLGYIPANGSLSFAQLAPPLKSPPKSHNPYIPIVPAWAADVTNGFFNAYFSQYVELDGRNSYGESFEDATTIVYGGGPYHMQRAKFNGTVKIELIGAAANTAHFLETFGFVKNGETHEGPSPEEMNTPIKKTTHTTIKGDFVSPYDGRK
jgi:hypothetical protein